MSRHDQSKGPSRSAPTIVIAPDEYGGWSWRLFSARGELLARAGTEWESPTDCEQAVNAVRAIFPAARVDRPDSSGAVFLGVYEW